MGFFDKLLKAHDPRKALRPKQLAKDMLAKSLDPLGSTIRQGRGRQAASTSIKDHYDPGGLVGKMTPQPAAPAPNSYQPRQRMQLSPGAQALYDSMMARSAQRATAGYRVPGSVPQGAPQNPMMQQPQVAPSKPMPGIATGRVMSSPKAPPQVGIAAPQQLADGGKVRRKLQVDAHYESKSFNRKPNGKHR
jgi:hypothetical protein